MVSILNPEPTQVFITLTQEDRRYKTKEGHVNGRGPFVKRAIETSHYPVAIGLVSPQT